MTLFDLVHMKSPMDRKGSKLYKYYFVSERIVAHYMHYGEHIFGIAKYFFSQCILCTIQIQTSSD